VVEDKTINNYETGYGKPPRHTRFQKGHSGNPKGRPRGSKNTNTLLMEALREPVIISENGRRKKITKWEAIVKQIVNKAASGDYRSIQFLLANLIPAIEARLESDPSKPLTIVDLLNLAILPDGTTRERQCAKQGKMIDQQLSVKPDAPAS
jgi:hypothetical protein